ncbi:hypothetical protein [Rhodoferax sp. WC2427]|uniref:hypothetical protein n=1 Tax=Rhodoferax sp. WC2427 TaxID=3234144 RepID=UPI003466BCA8
MSAGAMLATTSATERLENSRALLRQALQGKAKSRPASGASDPAPEWLAGLKSIPLVTVLVEAVSSWWMQHPLRIASLVAVDTARVVVQPLARSNPLGLVAGALVLGAVVAWARPWRWVLKPAMLAGLWPQLLSKGIAHLPMESWLDALASVARQRPAAQTSATPPPM